MAYIDMPQKEELVRFAVKRLFEMDDFRTWQAYLKSEYEKVLPTLPEIDDEQILRKAQGACLLFQEILGLPEKIINER